MELRRFVVCYVAQMTPMPSRFAGYTPASARWMLGLLCAAMLISLWPAWNAQFAPKAEVSAAKTEEGDADILLYSTIIERVRSGDGYYLTAAEEQRANGYPLRPFVTMRLPTLATLISGLGTVPAKLFLMALTALALMAWQQRLKGELPRPGQEMAGAALLFPGMMLAASTHYLPFHEVWAGILIALSIGVHRPQQWIASFLVAASALIIRETALPFVLLMAAFAMYHRRWKESAAWALLVLSYAALLYGHMLMVAQVVRADDLASPPWTEFGGLSAALSFFHLTSAYRGFSALFAYPLIVLSIFGWLSWRSPTGLFCFLLFLGYGFAFMVTGRANNFYWGLMVTPLLPIGLVFLRSAIRDLANALETRKLDLLPQ